MARTRTELIAVIGLIFCVGTPLAHASSLEDGLIAWWRMELKVGSTIPDASGNYHDLTVNGSPTFEDNIVIFNDDGTLETPDSDALDLMGDWSTSFWAREDSNDHSPNTNDSNGWMSKLRAYHASEGGWFLNSSNNTSVHASIYGSTNCNHDTPDRLTLGAWYRITTTFDSATNILRIYLNQNLEYEADIGCTVLGNDYPVLLGGCIEANMTRRPFCKGAMSDVRIYDRTLSDSEVAELFAMGSPQDGCDDFEDGVIDAAPWEWGGLNRATSGGQGGDWEWSHEEIVAPDDGYLSMHVSGPGSPNTFGAEAWVRTLYDYNDGANHVINFTWEADVQDFHYNHYFIQVTDGYISPDGNIHWSGEPNIPGTTNLLWYLDGNGSEFPGARYPMSEFNANWSMSIDSSGVVQLYDDSGSLLREESLDDSYPWYVRFMVVDATSAGFPAGDIRLNLYEFCTDDGGEPDEEDSDSDGVPDEEDECPESDLDATIVIAECDTGVENEMLDDGCTMADLIMQCAEDAVNHGAFVRCVSHLANLWKCQGLINGQKKGAMMSCAGQANLP